MLRRIAICLLPLVFLGMTRSAAAQTVTDGRAWLTVSLQGRMAKQSPWRWTFDSIFRSREGVSALDTSSFRPSLVFTVSSRTSVGAGYALADSYPVTGGAITEHRLFGLYNWTGPARGGTVSLRIRLEDRLIEGNSGALWRVRPLARVTHPVRPGGRLSLVGYDELSLHLNTTTRSPRGVDQNRAFAGIGDTWSPRFRAEIGYLNQYIPGHRAANRMNHVVVTTATVTF